MREAENNKQQLRPMSFGALVSFHVRLRGRNKIELSTQLHTKPSALHATD